MPIIRELDRQKKIDSIENFEKDRAVIVLSGENDASVPAVNVEGIFEIYSELGLNGDEKSDGQNLKHVNTGQTGHDFSDTYPETMLSFIYNKLGYTEIVHATSSTDNDRDGVLGTFTQFCQREFFPDSIDWETNSHFQDRQNGWIYTPAACEGADSINCRVHFAFHGCGARA